MNDELLLHLPFDGDAEFRFRQPKLSEFDFFRYHAHKLCQLQAFKALGQAKDEVEAEKQGQIFGTQSQALARMVEKTLIATVLEGADVVAAINAAGHQRTQVLVTAGDALSAFVAPPELARNLSDGSSESAPAEPAKAAQGS